MRKHWRLLWRVLPYLRPHKWLTVNTFALTIVSSVVALAEPWPLAFLVDGVLGTESSAQSALPRFITDAFGTEPRRLIVVAVIAGLVITATIHGVALLNEYVRTKLSQRMILQFRSDLVENALRQSVAFHDARSMGDFIARINYEASSMGHIVVALPPLIESVLTLIGMAYVTYRIDAELALVALVVVPFVYYATGYYGKNIEPRIRHVRGLEGGSITIVYEAMSMLRVIAVFNREKYEHRRFHEQASEAVDGRVKLTVRQSLFSLAVNFITAVGSSLVLGIGAYHVLDGRLSVGEVLVLVSYVHSIYGPLEAISHSMAMFQEQFIYLDMSLELLDQVPDVADEPDATELPPIRGAVDFEAVGFAYAGRESTLEDISFHVEPGEAIAIVGPTGAGKTTLMSLLSRLAQPQSGRVLIDGIDIREVTLSSLRSQISVVLQEPSLFTGTVAENIRYGLLEASDEQVVEAAVAANAHDFIMRLPQQYATLLGENGTALSGGEKQRICVARAFLKDAPILILDEPTSSIDSRTEAVILDALEKLMEGRTTFMIAHRLSTLRSVDRILVLDRGRLVEEGPHHELLEQGGLYRTLHDVQAMQGDRFHELSPAGESTRVARDREAILLELEKAAARLRDRSSALRRQQPEAPGRPRSKRREARGGSRRATVRGEQVPGEASVAFRADPNPIVATRGSTGTTKIIWTTTGFRNTEVRIGAPDGALFAAVEHDPAVASTHERTTGDWVTDGLQLFLQDVTDGKELTPEHTIAWITVTVESCDAPVDPTVIELDIPADAAAP